MENMENIMVNEEVEVMDIDTVEQNDSGISTGVAMAIGAGITFVIGAGVKLAKKYYTRWKNSKNNPTAIEESPAEEAVNDVDEN